MRQGAKTLNVVILMKSPHYARTWKLSGIIGLTDPCFENTVAAISAQSFPLSDQVTFDTSSTDKVSTDLNRAAGWCGTFAAQSISCTAAIAESIGAG